MTAQQIERIEKVINSLITQTIEAGATTEQAIDHTYHELKRQHPLVLAAYLVTTEK